MNDSRFSIYDALVYAIKSVVDNFFFFLAATALAGLAFAGFVVAFFLLLLTIHSTIWRNERVATWFESVITYSPISTNIVVLLIVTIPLLVIMVGILLGYKKLLLDFYDKGTKNLGTLFSCFRKTPAALVALGILFALPFAAL